MQASLIPTRHSEGPPIIFGLSGFPKFKQLVIAIGLAPTDIKFLQLSQTICFPPVTGCALQQFAEESTVKAMYLSFMYSYYCRVSNLI